MKRISIAFVNAIAAITLLMLLWFLYSFYLENIRYMKHENSMAELKQIKEKIRFYDEVLTMSAKMAVVTGDDSWEKRYRDAEQQLNQNIESAKVLFPNIFKKYIEETNLANAKLIEYENNAFVLIGDGESQQAKEQLFNDDYDFYKQQYSKALNSLHIELDKMFKEKESNTKTIQKKYLFSSVLIILIFSIVWVYLNIVLFRRQVLIGNKEVFLQGVLDNAVDGIISIGEKGNILTVNPAAENLFGYDASEMIGENVKMLMPSPYHEEHDGYLSNYYKTGKKKIIGIGRKVAGQRKDGSTFPMELSVSENRVGDKLSYTGIVRDISERLEQQRNIEDQKEYYENLFKYLNVPAFILDMDHKVTMWNKACENMTGAKTHEIIGTRDYQKAIYKEARPLLADLVLDDDYSNPDLYPVGIEDSIMPKGKRAQNWVEFPLKGDEALYLTFDAGPIFDAAGKKIAVIQIMQDITSMKELEDSIQKNNEQLKRSNDELERFAYVASHDLQEPLRMVSSYTQLLAKRYQDKLDQDANDYIDYAVDGAARMQSLIQDLLKYSRLNTEAKASESVDANSLFEYAIQNLSITIDESGTVVTKDELPMVLGDNAQLRQLFQNLIGNAVKYRDPEKLNKVHVTAEDKGKSWQFCVEDNGIGIEPEYFEKIFVIFKRLHTRTEYTGTGIGLSLCKRIVEAHNGRIWIESEPGQGCRFYFTLMKIVQ